MGSANEIDNVMRRTQRYWYEDGFNDMGFGGWVLFIGLLFVVQELVLPRSPLLALWSVAWPLLFLGSAFVMNRVIRTLKERITYPRTGYVHYERARGTSRVLRLLAVVIISAGVSAAIVIVQKNWLSLTVIFGFIYAVVLMAIGLRFSLRRYLALALWSLVLGLALAPLALSIDQSAALFHIGAGAAWLLAGGLTYRHYIASAPQPQGADDGASS